MRFDANAVIYGYLFICVALLVFNLFYIFRAKGRKKQQKVRAKEWQREIEAQLGLLARGSAVEETHRKRMLRVLRSTNGLISYSSALEAVQRTQPVLLAQYLRESYAVLQELAVVYGRKQSMERAYFADVIARFRPCSGEEFRPLMEILLSYLADSTVYCRENVLHALCALGNGQAVETALQILNDNEWFHHQKLLSDGLTAFSGDREALAARLWRHAKDWNAYLMLSVVQFITNCSDSYRETFLPVLCAPETDPELRLALMRYYRRHPYGPARPVLLEYLRGAPGQDVNLAVVSAAVLDRYPGIDTVEALKQALGHPNWYVRYNAAASLVHLEVDIRALREVLQGGDRYAKEILQYMLEEKEMGRA